MSNLLSKKDEATLCLLAAFLPSKKRQQAILESLESDVAKHIAIGLIAAKERCA